MKKVNGHEIIQLFEEWSPKKFAVEDDPVGLQVGRLNEETEKVLVTLDVNEKVLDEAIEKGVKLIIAHHPPIFRRLKHIRTDLPQGRMFEKCIKHDISIYAAHTNLDVAPGGVNDLLAEVLELKQCEVMDVSYSEPLYKLAVFVPVTHADTVRAAIAKAGAGAIGDYYGCSFSSVGTGRFTPGNGADPFIGENGKPEVVEEERIEVVLPQSIRSKVLQAMLKAHPYEEVAYDFFQLDQRTNDFGLGRVGKLKEDMTLKEFAEFVKERLSVPAVRAVGDMDAKVRKVAVLGGDGNKYIYAAKRKGADVFVTGDLYYHVAHDALDLGLSVVDPGHNVEKVMIEGVVRKMSKLCEERGFICEFIPSEIDTEPFKFI